MKYLLVVLVIAAAFVYVGTGGFEDEQKKLERYCANVKAGFWADYKNIFDAECKKPLPPSNLNVIIQRY